MIIKNKFRLFFALFLVISTDSAAQNSDSTYLYLHVDEIPKFGETKEDLSAYIYIHLTWPKHFSGDDRILMSLVITKSGQVTNVKIEKAICIECAEIVKQLLQSMPTWKPGKKNGISVDVKLYLPVDFTIK